MKDFMIPAAAFDRAEKANRETMNKHSPGPWHTDATMPTIVRAAGRYERRVATCENKEDARLIAAAPEMLALIRNAVEQGVMFNLGKAEKLLKRIDGE